MLASLAFIFFGFLPSLLIDSIQIFRFIAEGENKTAENCYVASEITLIIVKLSA